MKIEELLKNIVDKARQKIKDENWNKDEIIRYVYILLGKEINRDADFFFSSGGKLKENNLSVQEMKRIQEKEEDYDVTCKVTAKMLFKIFSQLGIESEIVKTVDSKDYTDPNGNKYDIYHYFILVTGENNNKYFLTLNGDLGNIKFGFKTPHFANLRPYIVDGKQYYEGKDRHNIVMDESKLKEIDKKIGYLSSIDKDGNPDYVSSVSEVTSSEYKAKYVDALIEEDYYNFYKRYMNLFAKFKKNNFNQLTSKETFEVTYYILDETLKLIEEKLKYNIGAKDLSNILKLYSYEKYDDLKKYISDMINKVINDVNPNQNKEKYNNIFILMSTAVDTIQSIEKLRASTTEEEQKIYSKEYRRFFYSLSQFFIDPNKLEIHKEGKSEYSNLYIKEKVKLLLEKDLECNYLNSNYSSQFSSLGILDQSAFLKSYLFKILKTEFNTEDEEKERIILSTVQSKTDNSYCFIMYFHNDVDKQGDHTYVMLYDPAENKLYDGIDYIKLQNSYNIYSDSLNNKLVELENKGMEKDLRYA